MSRFANAFGPDRPAATYVAHAFPEQLLDTGEVRRRRGPARSFPTMGHSMHGQDAKRFRDVLVEWVGTLG